MAGSVTEGSPHIAYCGGSFGRVSLMAADTELAEHARECMQLLINVHRAELSVRVDGATHALKPYDALAIGPRQTYAVPRQPHDPPCAGAVGFILVKTCAWGPRVAQVGAAQLGESGSGRLPLRALPSQARTDAAQLVDDLLRETPHTEAIERGVLALRNATAMLLGSLPRGERPSGLEARIARDTQAEYANDLQEFDSASRRAATYCVSERHFGTLFRRATRLPPKAFYNMRRLEAAFKLLSQAPCSITKSPTTWASARRPTSPAS